MSNLEINRFVSVKWKNHGQCNECFSCVSSFPSSQALCAVFFLIDFKLLPFLESREEQCPLQRVGAFLYNKQMFLTSIILHKKISCLFLGGGVCYFKTKCNHNLRWAGCWKSDEQQQNFTDDHSWEGEKRVSSGSNCWKSNLQYQDWDDTIPDIDAL